MSHNELSVTGDDLIGQVLLGRYRVVRELAKGGMGVVYLARAEGAVGFVKPVVIKLVLPQHAEDPRFVAMFVREAQILAQLRHPSVVDVLEFGEQDGAYVLVLEYVRGYHLGQWMRYLALKKRQANVEILIQIVIDVLEALHHAHNQVHPDGTPMQIVHRDISPSNVLLDEDGRGRLLDFGVARMRGGGGDDKTQFKGFIGKLPYTAPEVFAGSDASPRSDLYACAVVLHELLIGRNVFRSENQAATMNKVMSHVPEPVERARAGVPVGLDAVLQRGLAKSPEDRYPDARAFAAALRKLQREQESDIRARLSDLLRVDFGPEMAQLLRLESLADRDEAWRRLSERPPRTTRAQSDDEPSATRTRGASPHSASGMMPRVSRAEALAPDGATVAEMPSARASRPPPPPAAADPEGATVAEMPRVPAAVVTAQAAATGSAGPPATANVVAPTGMAPAASRAVLIGLGAACSLALVAIALSLRPPPRSAAAAVAPQIHVVASPAAPPVQIEPPSAPPAAASESAQAKTQTLASASSRRKAGDRRASAPDARSLTRAFRSQQPKLEACFEQHPGAAQGHAKTEVQFDLDASGKLTRVALQPRSLASTPLGACLLQIARKTEFPAQGQAVSFAIPVIAGF